MKYFYYLIAGCLFLSSCTNDNPIIDEPIIEETENKDPNQDLLENPYKTIELSEIEQAVANCQTNFAFDFFNAASKRSDNENFVVSPISAYVALSNIANGTAGETKDELISRLLDKTANLDDLNNYNKRIIAELSSLDKTVQVELANSIWYNPTLTIEPAFASASKNFYNASINSVDFSDPKSINVMNDWISNASHGLIKKLSNPNSNTQLIIANVLYYNGKWMLPFDKTKTEEADFYNNDGSTSKIKMMEGEHYHYFQADEVNGKFVIVKIPYGYRNFSFYVAFSIDENDYSLNDIDKIFSANNLNKINRYAKYGKKFVKLPRFEVSSDDQITQDMEAIGLGNLFSDKADLTNLTKQPLGEKFIIQKCTLKVEETGAEGSALTEYDIISSDIDSKPILVENPSFIVDRPFVFWIMEENTNSILFMGQINKL